MFSNKARNFSCLTSIPQGFQYARDLFCVRIVGMIIEFRKKLRGIGLCLAIAFVAYYLGNLLPVVGGPVFSIIIGALLALFIKNRDPLNPGLAFTSKIVLQMAVVLLGFGMNLSVIVSTGRESLPIIVTTIATALITAYIIYKTLDMPSKLSVLVGVGSSICGGSAIAATAPIIDAKDEEIAQSISVIFFFNVLAALIFPTLGGLIGLSDYGFGLFAGTAVNDTSSVTAAASAWDAIYASNTLATATIVKLTRTLAIIPISLGLAFYQMGKNPDKRKERVKLSKLFPFFILYFILASIVTTVALHFGVSQEVFLPFKDLSKFFILMAMAAIGMNTDLVKLVKSGAKPLFMGLCCWISIAGVSLFMQKLLGLF